MFHSVWTAILLLIFIGIVAWVWSSKRKSYFEEAARIALDDDAPVSSDVTQENLHG
jgi:cytochrome c oxidase cbb3-type subunit IV